MEAILADHLRIRLPFGLVLGQPHLLNPPSIAVVPRQRCHGLKPVRRHGGHRVQRSPEGFCDEVKTVQHTDRGQHMRRVGALLLAGLEPTHGTAPL